jgi:hypothetical protein
MLGYRRQSFIRIHTLLREMLAVPLDAALTFGCQKQLIREIQHAERKVSQYKAELKTRRREVNTSKISKESVQTIRKRIRWLEGRLDGYRHVIYIWRCFGDAIAFHGLDKYAIKATYYETVTGNIKPHAGFLSGKAGLSEELRALETITNTGMPCVLTDLTNSLRHGDVCILTGSDPYLIEVKSSKELNYRGKRQVEDTAKIHSFFATDKAVEGWHGTGDVEVRRAAVHAEDVCYVDAINTCMERATKFGTSTVSPEPGLHYVATYGDGSQVRSLLRNMKLEAAICYHLNQWKAQHDWSPYVPFTINIRGQQHLLDFIRGDLSLMVFLDFSVMQAAFAERGFQATYQSGSSYRLRLVDIVRPEYAIQISEQYFSRMGLEFMAPSWMVEHQVYLRTRFFEGQYAKPDTGQQT